MRRKKWWVAAATALLVALVGAITEQIARERDRRRYAQVGRSYDVGGRTLNLFCSGQGSPTVVLGTFAHQAGFEWTSVQPEVAKFTRACWYDRAGYGWSDPGPLYRTAGDFVEDLHALLQAARERPPFVFVGNSDVTLQIRVYQRLYPAEAAGAVFIDGNDVDEGPPPPLAGQPIFRRLFGSTALPAARWTVCRVVPAAARFGLLRVIGGQPRRTNRFDLSPEQQIQHAFLSDNATAIPYTQTAQCMQEVSRQQARLTRDLGSLPLIVLTSDSTQEFLAVQSRLAALSTRGRLEIVSGQIRREAIVEGIKRVVDDALRRPELQ
jgi:pimeloyl-ACP methyl ester carboxylesterase